MMGSAFITNTADKKTPLRYMTGIVVMALIVFVSIASACVWMAFKI